MLKIYLLEKVSWKVMTRRMRYRTKKDVHDLHHDNLDRLHLAKAGTAHLQALDLALVVVVEHLLVKQDDIDHQIAIGHALIRVQDLNLAHRLPATEVERIDTDLLQTLVLDLVLLNDQEGIVHLPALVLEDDR